MPRYFFDIDDGMRLTVDDVGQAIGSREVARRMAISALPAIAGDALPDGDRYRVSVLVRNGAGRPVFHARLELLAEWLE